eukprot:m.40958 g.40958  ORF g.40958 m.40958 type:complete len:177 (-) comp5644_c0_seq3:144-674(-)
MEAALSSEDTERAALREIGDLAVWSLSSCKQGFGVDQLRDGSVSTYWQSDGPQPHLVNIQFHRKTVIHSVRVYVDFKQDESYTPNKLSVRVGTNFYDLKEISILELNEPSGWIEIALQSPEKPVRAFLVQLAVLSNHQNGRDTHIRLVDIFTPQADLHPVFVPFSQPETLAGCCIR